MLALLASTQKGEEKKKKKKKGTEDSPIPIKLIYQPTQARLGMWNSFRCSTFHTYILPTNIVTFYQP